MSGRFRGSIALKMTLLVLGGTSLVFALVQGYSYWYSRQIILDEVEKNARSLTLSAATRIEQEFRAVAKIPQNMRYFLESGQDDEETLLRVLKRVVAGNPEVYGAAVGFEPYAAGESKKRHAPYFHKTDEGISFIQLANLETEYFKQDWYHIPRVMAAPVWSEPYYDEGGGEIVMITYSCPFFAPGGDQRSPIGVITADISLAWLTHLVSSARASSSGFCFIISETGTFISHPEKKWIMSESMFSLADERRDQRLRRIGQTMIREPAGFMDIGRSLTGEDAFLAHSLIPSTGWSFGATFPKSELFREIEGLHRTAVTLALVGLALLLATSILVATSMARPLRKMAEATGKVAEGDLDIDLTDIRSRDEVGRLAQAFTRMTEGLKERDRIRNTFGRYVTREVVNRLLESRDGLRLGGQSKEITMIMSDLRGFTALTASMPPEDVLAFLNRYLGKMVEILIDHRGIIDEIIGDGILAFFGAPEPMEDHAAAAVASALRMQQAMEDVNDLNEADGLARLEMGIAVNTGRVVVGNIGSEKRAKYGAVGSQVNFTGRMESFSVGGQVLVSQSTYEILSDVLDVKGVLQVEMKGIPGKVNLYDIRGIRGAYSVQLPEKPEISVSLKRPIPVQVYRLEQKMVRGGGTPARFTQISLTSATMVLEGAIDAWEDLRISILDDSVASGRGEVFGKVVWVAPGSDGVSAVVRFTSVSPDAYKLFRRAMQAKTEPFPA